ncbi:MAG: serine/threonine protein kinase [Chitinophagaceae bacterium]|nr:serine/threonine protein kinase [Anaerolineae bacterium]
MAKRPVKPTIDKPATLVGIQLGDYKLKEMLATGGMARIYKGEDVKLGRMAAVKVLTREMLETDETLSGRFQREAKAVATMEHDNIITIYQYGEQDGLYFLVMKLVEGGDLADELNALQRQGKLIDTKRLLDILGQVASALDHAHAAGIIHRDVKPSNILMDKSGKAILTDFGLVLKQQHENTMDKTMGTAFGTPRYISPEQALASERAVAQSDIYSLAVILYEGLTGSMVFKADTAMQIALSHISEPPPSPRTINPNIPRAVEREVLKALDKDPKKRHKTAVTFIAAVKEGYGDQLNAKVNEISPEILRSATPVFTTAPNMELMLAEKKAAEAQKQAAIPKAILDDKSTLPEARRPEKKQGGSRILRILLLLILVGAVSAAAFVFMNRDRESQTTSSTNTPSIAVVATDRPATDTPTDQAEPSATTASSSLVLPEGGEVVSIFYNFEAFAFRNDGDAALDVSQLVVGVDGVDSYRGSSVTGGSLPPGECLVITRSGQTTPPESWNCGDPYSPSTIDDPFWRTTAGVNFEVRVEDAIIVTCNTINRGSEGECNLTWPFVPDAGE